MSILPQTPLEALFTRAATDSFFVFLAAVNAISVDIKLRLWKAGFRGWFNINDLRDLRMLAAREPDSRSRAACNRLHLAWHVCFVLVFIVPFAFLGLAFLSSHLF
jgi:hypothetical protein